MVRWASSRRTDPGTTLAPTLNPTFSTKVGSAAVLAASSAGVRKYTPVSFTPSAIRNPTLPTMRAAPSKNLWPAFIPGSVVVIRCFGERFASRHRDSSTRAGRLGLECLFVERIDRRLVVGILGPGCFHLGVVVRPEPGVGLGQGLVVL